MCEEDFAQVKSSNVMARPRLKSIMTLMDLMKVFRMIRDLSRKR